MISLINSEQFYTGPSMLWTIQYEYRRNGADMQYRFYWKIWLRWEESSYDYGLQLQFFLDGAQHNVTVKGETDSLYQWSYDGTTDWYTVAGKTSGSTSLYIRLYDTSRYETKHTSSTFYLTVTGAASVLGDIQNFNVDVGATIPITKYDGNFTDSLVVSYGGTTICTVSNVTNGSVVAFNSQQLGVIYSLMKSVNEGTFTFALTTKSGNTTIGSSSDTAKGVITGANPIYTNDDVTYMDESGVVNITGNNQHIVQRMSSLVVNLGAARGNKGADITKYSVTVNGVTKEVNSAGNVAFGAIDSASNVTVNVTVYDTRGNHTSVSRTVTMIPYNVPDMNVTLERLNNYEDTTYLTIRAIVSSVNGRNGRGISYMYKESGGQYSPEEPFGDGATVTLSCDKEKSFVFHVNVWDSFTSTPRDFVLDKGKFPLFIDTSRNAVGINAFPADGEALHVSDGLAVFDDGIVLKSANHTWLITVTDSGTFSITQKT